MRTRKAELVAELEEARRLIAEMRARENVIIPEQGDEEGEQGNENENNGQDDNRNNEQANVNADQQNEVLAAMERMHRRMQELEEENQYYRNQNQYYDNQAGREDENMRELKLKKLAAETEQRKFDIITKRIGPYSSSLNSDVWAQRLEYEREAEELSWEYFLKTMRLFFTATDDKTVKMWFQRREVLLVPKINQARTDEQRKTIWKEFRDEFVAQYDPKVSAQLAEDKYERFELKKDMSAEEFVNQLQDVLLETDPQMSSEVLVRQMHRKLPTAIRTQVADPYLSVVPKFLQRLKVVLEGDREKKDTEEANKEQATDNKNPNSTSKEIVVFEGKSVGEQSESLSLKLFQGACHYCKKIGHKAAEYRTKKREEEQGNQNQNYSERVGIRNKFSNFGRAMSHGNMGFRGMPRGRGFPPFRGPGRGIFRGRPGFRGGFFQARQEPTVKTLLQEVLQRQIAQPSMFPTQLPMVNTQAAMPQMNVQPQQQQGFQPQGFQQNSQVFKPENY